MENLYLIHHGIKGQKHGVRNAEWYPISAWKAHLNRNKKISVNNKLQKQQYKITKYENKYSKNIDSKNVFKRGIAARNGAMALASSQKYEKIANKMQQYVDRNANKPISSIQNNIEDYIKIARGLGVSKYKISKWENDISKMKNIISTKLQQMNLETQKQTQQEIQREIQREIQQEILLQNMILLQNY